MEHDLILTNFEHILPAIKVAQDDIREFIIKTHIDHERAKTDREKKNTENLEFPVALRKSASRYTVSSEKIGHRYFESLEVGASHLGICERNLFFVERATEVLHKFYPENATKPDHLIHVTCTGYVSPSPAQRIVNARNWNSGTGVTHAYHMGCYAALPAVRLAEGLIHNNPRVDIVHNEMCGLHLNPLDHRPEQLIVQSLFADGHIKYVGVHQSKFQATNSSPTEATVTQGLKVHAIHEEIIPNSQEDMSWIPAEWGMKMSLSRDVPEKISGRLKGFVRDLVGRSNFDLESILKTATFAIHPGGPKIIEKVQEILGLSEEQIAQSRAVLLERGNMSSATLPHIWERFLNSAPKKGSLLISLAFGPGLTIFGSIFEVQNSHSMKEV